MPAQLQCSHSRAWEPGNKATLPLSWIEPFRTSRMQVTLRVEQSQRRRQRVVGLVPRLHRHPGVAKYTCVYDVQLLAIWRIPLLAVVLLLSLALCIGLLRRLPTSPCLFCFRNDRLERRVLCKGLFIQVDFLLGCFELPKWLFPFPLSPSNLIYLIIVLC